MSFQGLAGPGTGGLPASLPAWPSAQPPASPHRSALPCPVAGRRASLLAQAMATFNLRLLPPNPEEKDFIQAYEDVRERYKGSPAGPRGACRGREPAGLPRPPSLRGEPGFAAPALNWASRLRRQRSGELPRGSSAGRPSRASVTPCLGVGLAWQVATGACCIWSPGGVCCEGPGGSEGERSLCLLAGGLGCQLENQSMHMCVDEVHVSAWERLGCPCLFWCWGHPSWGGTGGTLLHLVCGQHPG